MTDPTVSDGLHRYVERICAAYPNLTIHSAISVTGLGQNNAILIVNGNPVFRFPLYRSGVERLGRLVRILQVVAPSVAVSVPKPIYVALENSTTGHAFIGYPLIQGDPLGGEVFDGLPDEDTRQSLADQISVFLKQFHAVPPECILPNEARAYDPLAEVDFGHSVNLPMPIAIDAEIDAAMGRLTLCQGVVK